MVVQDSKYLEQFHVLKVDQNNIRMSDFVKKKIGTFENGKIFYEFKQDEDLPCYKEVVHVPSDVYTNRMRVHIIQKVYRKCIQMIKICQYLVVFSLSLQLIKKYGVHAAQVLSHSTKFLECLVLKSNHHHHQTSRCLFKAHHKDLDVLKLEWCYFTRYEQYKINPPIATY